MKRRHRLQATRRHVVNRADLLKTFNPTRQPSLHNEAVPLPLTIQLPFSRPLNSRIDQPEVFRWTVHEQVKHELVTLNPRRVENRLP
jgi:hypothetical protein